jgi:GT2 family glycosyltransferase
LLKKKMPRQPRVAVVVLNFKALVDTKNCVLSLMQCGYPNLSIILVDNASQDGSAEELARTFPDLPLLVQSHNLGYAGGNNVGIRYALGTDAEYVLITNDDVTFESGFLEPMIALMEREREVGVVAPKVFRAASAGDVFAAVGEFSWLLCTGLDRGRNKSAYESTTLECDVDYVPGVLLLSRREVFETVGLLDERFFMYFEDVEFSHRVQSQYRMMYTARSVAYHKGGAGRGWRNYSILYLYYHTRNRIWAFRDKSCFYRLYVLLFTMVNVLAKSVFISSNLFRDRRRTLAQWNALMCGFVDGCVPQETNRAFSFRRP